MSDGNGHTGSPLPLAIVGAGVDRVRGGRHVVMPDGTPTANLHLAIGQKFGIEQERFGVSTGTVPL
jgi:hypothetical protein